MTRDELWHKLYELVILSEKRTLALSQQLQVSADVLNADVSDKVSEIVAAYDAQAAEIHLVRERNAELAAQRLELDSQAYYEGRIAELEDALRGLYDHTKNNQQICGLNERARAVLDKEA